MFACNDEIHHEKYIVCVCVCVCAGEKERERKERGLRGRNRGRVSWPLPMSWEDEEDVIPCARKSILHKFQHHRLNFISIMFFDF